MSGSSPIAVTLGEPAGVGPEIIAAAWQRRNDNSLPPFFWLGSTEALRAQGVSVPVAEIAAPEEVAAAFGKGLPVLPRTLPAPVVPGRPDRANAPAIIAAIEEAVSLVTGGRATALVTAPIQKSTLRAAGFEAPGHTECLARLAGRPAEDAVMMLTIPGLRVVPLTIHVPLARVPVLVTAARLRHVAEILHRALRQDFGIAEPRIAVAGLNPHAGEAGVMGDEEECIIAPAIAALRTAGLDIRGPLSADTMFHAEARAGYDAALCMYHDQALIPLKTLDFHGGVNITLGLPFVRTSPDHGTALALAASGKARPDSLIAAIRMAADIAARRRMT
ncbi:MAG: 4-hydroxythreonine-4-phosphate dehydrogenase PdxA [Rhodothalassiaceae bacterium]